MTREGRFGFEVIWVGRILRGVRLIRRIEEKNVEMGLVPDLA